MSIARRKQPVSVGYGLGLVLVLMAGVLWSVMGLDRKSVV